MTQREQVERRRDVKERREDPRVEVLYLRDKTFSVKTLDIKEHFSKFGDVVKLKFIGRQDSGNLFKAVVPWHLALPDSSTICGVELEVEKSSDGDCTVAAGSCSELRKTSSRASEWSSSRYDEEYGRVGKRRSRMTFLARVGMWRERQVDMERQGMEANTKVKGETSGRRSIKYAEEDSGEDSFPTCPVCDRVFYRGNSWRDNEHARLIHMKKHNVDELAREQKTPLKVSVDHSPQPWSPFRGEVLLDWGDFEHALSRSDGSF